MKRSTELMLLIFCPPVNALVFNVIQQEMSAQSVSSCVGYDTAMWGCAHVSLGGLWTIICNYTVPHMTTVQNYMYRQTVHNYRFCNKGAFI